MESKDDKTGRKKRQLIWPRYHQLDVVRRLLADASDRGAGPRYLIQHSAGSGKSNSIAWLAHQLIGLKQDGKALFDSAIVVTDRRILDKQIRDTITAAVAPRPNSPATGAPTISGTAQVGETLTASTSDIDDADGMSGAVFSYRWLANGADIAGATSDTHTLVETDVGKAIKVRVIFTDNGSHQETLTSEATAAVAPAADESAIWSATLTVGSFGDFLGYYSFTRTGELSPNEFTLDGTDYTMLTITVATVPGGFPP